MVAEDPLPLVFAALMFPLIPPMRSEYPLPAVNSATTIAAGARTPAVSIAPVTFPYAMPATTTTISVVNTGIDFTVATEPVLMPALEMVPENKFQGRMAAYVNTTYGIPSDGILANTLNTKVNTATEITGLIPTQKAPSMVCLYFTLMSRQERK